MAKYNVSDIRNVALCGHGASGKTTLVDKLLNLTGAVTRPASVDDGTSVCDFDEEEKHHKYSIEAALVHFDHGGKRFNLIDTPGYPDFIGQAIGALQAVETACIVVNAHSGIEVNTRRVFQEAGKAGVGRIIVVSKMDTENIDFPKLVSNIQEMWGKACVPLNVPLGSGHDFKGVASALKPPGGAQGALIDVAAANQALIETIVETDEEVLARYFDGTPPTDEEAMRLVAQGMAQGTLIPIVCVAAKTGGGLKELLDVLAMCAPSPDKMVRKATDDHGQELELKPDPAGPLVAQVWRTRIDPFVQKLSFIRMYSGTLKKDEGVHVSGARKNIKIGPLLEVQGHETKAIDAVSAGDIAAISKTEDLHTGTTLGNFVMPTVKFPRPMVGLAATPKTRGDEAKLSGALHKVVEEDSTFHIDRDPQTKELVMTGMSELHLKILRERIKRRDKVEVDVHEPKIPYRETVQQKAEGSYRHKKQSGGRGQFGEVHIRMFPFPKDTNPTEYCNKEHFPHMRQFHYHEKNNFLWVDSIVGGTIPNNFLPAVEKGFLERLERGVIAGYQVQNVGVEVHFGKYHDVDSSEAAFKTAGSMAFRNVFQEAKPGLLEPIVHLHITVPNNKVGDINSDMSGRRGRVLGMESAGGDLQTITVVVPLAEVTTYARSLSSMTGGLGSYTMDFSHYDVVPGQVQKAIIDKAVLHKEEEEE
ncbi:MAG TPA: elongation factor G [Pirellulales bacterium]|jgi:elongation factor G|nr:elongation factor G [Pirellulales bacterium]